jgi:hypothetical protein
MKGKNTKRNIVLSILFFLPVAFLLMLYPAKHNYEPLNIVHTGVSDIQEFYSLEDEALKLEDRITILGFLGEAPLKNATAASNLKELVYDKFKGFKKFQIVIIVPEGTEDEVEALKREVNTYEDLKYWHYAYGSPEEIRALFKSLRKEINLRDDLSTDHIFIIDKDLNQRGRIDGRTKKEIESNQPRYSVYSYNTIKVADIKNKMSEDIRILFTEYRQKRKGKFDASSTRRAQDLKQDNE